MLLSINNWMVHVELGIDKIMMQTSPSSFEERNKSKYATYYMFIIIKAKLIQRIQKRRLID